MDEQERRQLIGILTQNIIGMNTIKKILIKKGITTDKEIKEYYIIAKKEFEDIERENLK